LGSESDGADDEANQFVLTASKASDLCPKPFRLVARGRAFTQPENVAALSALHFVYLSDNALTSLEGLAGLPALKTSIAKGNRLCSIEPLLGLREVRVLNLTENKFNAPDWLLCASFERALNALILTGNRVSNLDSVATLSALETLVVTITRLKTSPPSCASRASESCPRRTTVCVHCLPRSPHAPRWQS
jgi:hypothetical protein